jgi:hypothetical protein
LQRTYVYGYSGQRFTRAQIEATSNFSGLHPEMRRRLWALMDASADAGHDLGVGSAWRSAARANELYALWKAGKRSAPAAPANKSYHCEMANGFCYAADMVGALGWMNANCHRFGLKHFANVNNEPWHVQPAEIPTRRNPNTPGIDLAPFALPGGAAITHEGDDEDMTTDQSVQDIVSSNMRWLVQSDEGRTLLASIVLDALTHSGVVKNLVNGSDMTVTAALSAVHGDVWQNVIARLDRIAGRLDALEEALPRD